MNGDEGFVKIIAHSRSKKVLGMQIVGPRATDMIAEGALALSVNAGIEDIINTIHAHPTVSEAVREAALAAWAIPERSAPACARMQSSSTWICARFLYV